MMSGEESNESFRARLFFNEGTTVGGGNGDDGVGGGDGVNGMAGSDGFIGVDNN